MTKKDLFPLRQFPPTTTQLLPRNSPMLLEGIDRGDVRQAERGREPRCHVATNREVLLEALAKEAVPEEDLLVQHTPDLTPLPVFIALHLWTLTLLPLAQQLPQIKLHHQNQPTLAMACDAIVFPDIVAEHVAYETANVTT